MGDCAHGVMLFELDRVAGELQDQIMIVKLRPASRLAVAISLVLAACATAQSGQTGSPVYESPNPEPPEEGGGIDNGEEPGVGAPSEDVMPEPPEVPGEVLGVGDHLLVAGRSGLAIYDVTSPNEPVEVGRLRIDGFASLLSADGLGKIALSVTETTRYQGTEIPAERLPPLVWRVLEVDASNPAEPRVTASFDVPAGTIGVVPDVTGYTLLGAERDNGEGQACAFQGGIELPSLPDPVRLLSVARFAALGGALVETGRRELSSGYLRISSDQSHVIRASSPPGDEPGAELELEVIELGSLASVLSVRVPASALGAASSGLISADYAGGVLVFAAGSRVLGFDDTGAALAPLSGSGNIGGVKFLPGGELIRLQGAASGLARLDRSAAQPLLSFVAGADRRAGWLEPFGDGFISLSGSGAGDNQSLSVATYGMAAGALELRDALDMALPYNLSWYPGGSFRVDAASERVLYFFPSQNGDVTRLSVIGNDAGQIVASEVVDTERVLRAPWLGADAAYAVADGTLSVLSIEAASGLSLSAAPPTTVVPKNVRAELAHAGQIWAAHRRDNGQTSLSVRDAEFAEPRLVEIPHAVENLVPIDDTHLLVFGFWVTGECDTWRELGGSNFAECGPDAGNGVSIVAADAAGPRVVTSFPLNSFMEGRPEPGIEQSINWNGYFQTAESTWALLATFVERCGSAESCERLGVPAYTSFGTSGCASGQECDSSVQTFTSGSRAESWLFSLDVSDPEAPVLSRATRGGGRNDFHETYENDVGNVLLRRDVSAGTEWAFTVQEPLYDAAGSSINDAHGNGMSRWHVQTIQRAGDGLAFDPLVNVPGVAIGLGSAPSGQLRTYTLEPAYRADGEQYMHFHQLRIESAGAFIEHSLDVGQYVEGAQARDGWIALLTHPENMCVEGSTYSLVAVDVSGAAPVLSEPLILPGPPDYGWSVRGYDRAAVEPGLIHLGGGPAGQGRLLVDLRTSPPSIVSYETR